METENLCVSDTAYVHRWQTRATGAAPTPHPILGLVLTKAYTASAVKLLKGLLRRELPEDTIFYRRIAARSRLRRRHMQIIVVTALQGVQCLVETHKN